MGRDHDRHVNEALEAARLLDTLADKIDDEAADSGSAVVGAVMRDCACQIRRTVEREKGARRRRGTWQGGTPLSVAASRSVIFLEKDCTSGSAGW